MKKVFVVGGGVDASNFESFEDYLLKKNFNPYEEKLKTWKDNLSLDLQEFCEVIRVPMPNSHFAEYRYWKIMFEKALAYFGEENVLVGHSLGATFFIKYLNENTLENISSIHLVAPASQDTLVEKLGSFLFERKLLGFKRYENITHFYFSKDDTVVPFYEYEYFFSVLPNAKYNIFEDKGHFVFQEHFDELVENILGVKT